MHAQNCFFLPLKCSNRAHSYLDKLMEALFFHLWRRQQLTGLEVAIRGLARSPAPAWAPSPGGGVGWSSAGRAPFSPAAGAGAAGSSGGAGGAGQPCWTHLLCLCSSYRVGLNEAQMHPPSPQCSYRSSPAFWKSCCKIRLQWRLLPSLLTTGHRVLLIKSMPGSMPDQTSPNIMAPNHLATSSQPFFVFRTLHFDCVGAGCWSSSSPSCFGYFWVWRMPCSFLHSVFWVFPLIASKSIPVDLCCAEGLDTLGRQYLQFDWDS